MFNVFVSAFSVLPLTELLHAYVKYESMLPLGILLSVSFLPL